MSQQHRDGNALAGPLADVFAVELSTAIVTCVGCRRTDPVAALHLYGGGPGLVARCRHCGTVLLRYVETPHGRWLDLRGTAALRFDSLPPS